MGIKRNKLEIGQISGYPLKGNLNEVEKTPSSSINLAKTTIFNASKLILFNIHAFCCSMKSLITHK